MMENEFYTDEFEQLVKEKADQFRMYPSKRVWHSIYNNLHPSRRWPSVFMSLLLISSLMLIGYLNTSDNNIARQINNTTAVKTPDEINTTQKIDYSKQTTSYSKTRVKPAGHYNNAFEDVITNEPDYYTYTVVKRNRPDYLNNPALVSDKKTGIDKNTDENNGIDLIQTVDSYIKSNKILTDITVANNKKNKPAANKPAAKLSNNNTSEDLSTEATSKVNPVKPAADNNINEADLNNLVDADKKAVKKLIASENKNTLTNEEKAWIENYALLNKPEKNKWKGRLSYQLYATPAVNYRKLSTNSKGSTTPFASANIEDVISQKPGFGMEAGAGLTYAATKRLQVKAGLQFNYTNYNIAADQTNHPVLTTILLNDPSTGYSYSAARTSTTSNPFNSTALQPITLHNRTYQVSLPVGLAYKLSSENNVDWFVGTSVQPTYVFGGNAHIISSDLKSYVSDPSSISTWNLNLGFETYMNFKLGSYNLQVGPQVRYQVYSTYRKEMALIEKPYAVGLKFGLTKGF